MNHLRHTNVLLTLLLLLLGAQLLTQWTTAPAIAPAAHAQGIPDVGAQNAQMIDQLKLLNKKVEDLSTLLQSGKVKVSVAAPAENR
jgi:hypothetical protein